MATDAVAADAAIYTRPRLKSRQEARIAESLAAEEAAGRLLALRGRTVALIVIAFFLFWLVPFPDVLFYELLLTLFIVAGYARHLGERLGLFRWWQPYAQIALDSALLAFTVTVPNPLAEVHLPAQMSLRFGKFIYFYILLVGLAFGYKPKLVIWGGITGAAAWAVAVAWIALLPNTILKMPASETADAIMSRLALPNFVDLNRPIQDIVVYLIVSALLALVVARSRSLVERQAALERERGNLARYFPPATVDRLARQDQAMAQVREQDAAVLFADLVGFTAWAERHTPQEAIGLLREVHARLEDEVFRCDGTLDKFIGDGLMATFGTPEPGERDVVNALKCLRSMADDFAAWNDRRQKRGKAPIEIAIGLHYGPVVVGNIGTDRRLEFAVLGDTVNVASRLEAMTRELNCVALISSGVANAVREVAPDEAETLLAGFVDRGEVTLKGREQPVDVLAYGKGALQSRMP
jgi:adenylate cyclase